MSGLTFGLTKCRMCGATAQAAFDEADDGTVEVHVGCDNCGYEMWGPATEVTDTDHGR